MSRMKWVSCSAFIVVIVLSCAQQVSALGIAVSFSKVFNPSTVGPGSLSTLRFEIDNADAVTAVSGIQFVDNFPLGMTIADPAAVTTDCAGAVISAPVGASTVTFSGGTLTASDSCFVTLNVVVSTAGSFLNISDDLTSSAGNSGPAIASLVVDGQRPGFSAIFLPNSIASGGTSTLTYFFDNGASLSEAEFITFIDNLPSGLVVATPSNAFTDCVGGIFPEIVATPGSSLIFLQFGAVDAGLVCSMSVDVTAMTSGPKVTATGPATALVDFQTVILGQASADLNVTVAPISIAMSFLDDPVAPGGTVALEFTLTNSSIEDPITEISFIDDLDSTLPGFAVIDPPASDVCGAGSLIAGTGLVEFTGGSLEPGGTCTFTVVAGVPEDAEPESEVTNTTSEVEGMAEEVPVEGLPATDDLMIGSVAPCTAPDGDSAMLSDDTIDEAVTVEVCSSVQVAPNLSVVGPNGALTIRAGENVEFHNGASVRTDGELVVEIDPDLNP